LTNYGKTNSSISGYNTATAYNYTKTNIISSTIQGNVVTGTDAKGGGVYTYGNATASGYYQYERGTNVLDTINSIIYANYNSTNDEDFDDLYFDGNRARTYNNAYTIYGTSNQVRSNASSQWVDMSPDRSKETIERIFENVVQNGFGHWVSDVGVDSTTTPEGDRTIEINENGLAARKGTMVGKDINGNYYFYKKYLDSKQWTSFTNGTTYNFDDNNHVYNPNFSFGLPAGSQIIRIAQNKYTKLYNPPYGTVGDNVLRISRDINDPTKITQLFFYNAGAYAIEKPVERISLVVNTLDDSFSLYDNEISLRDALDYAAEGVRLPLDNSSTITFWDELWERDEHGNIINEDITITLDDYYSALLISVAGSGKKITVNGRATDFEGTYYVDENSATNPKPADLSVRNIIVKRPDNSTENYSIFRTEETLDVNEKWDLTFRNLTIQNGKANSKDTGNKGGAIYVSGEDISTITLDNVTILNSSASSMGGAIYNAARSGKAVLHVLNSTIYGNTAGTGAGIYNEGWSDSDVFILNSTIAGNIANAQGGALYSYATNASSNVDIMNSILFGNYVQTTANDI